jgi:hypothetical protein
MGSNGKRGMTLIGDVLGLRQALQSDGALLYYSNGVHSLRADTGRRQGL